MTTTDIWLAAWLLANGATLVCVEKDYWSRFTFAVDSQLDALAEQFQFGHATIEAKEYAEACQQVRRVLRAA
jgi:hypothetical protein